MNEKRVISIALSMAVNCMTQTSTGLNITPQGAARIMPNVP